MFANISKSSSCSSFQIKALSDEMVIDFSYVYIKALSDGMVILIFICLHQGPFRWNGHWFSYVYIKALSDGMVIDFLMFTSRPSPMEWSLISLLQQDPLQWNGHLFLSWHQDPLLRNGRVFFFFGSWPFFYNWSSHPFKSIFLVTPSLFKTQTKLVSLSLLIFYCDTMKSQIFIVSVKS